MKISFLVTYYNQAPFVKQSLESIFSLQIPCDYEVLVGDDGSSDGTIDVVKEFQTKYPGVIHIFIMARDKNIKYNSILRASSNRLSLLNNATGNFFCILDGDDFYCDRNFVVDAIDIFSKYKTVSVCAFNFQFYTDNGVSPNTQHMPGGLLSAKQYIKKWYIHAGACVFRQVNSNERIDQLKEQRFFDDNDIVINNLCFGDLYYTDRVIYNYRQTGDSIWTSISYMEQCISNAIDYDVVVNFNKKNKTAVNKRFFPALLYLFLRKKRIQNSIGKEKYDKYLTLCGTTFLFYKLAAYDTISKKDKNKVKNFFLFHSILYPVLFLREMKHFVFEQK